MASISKKGWQRRQQQDHYVKQAQSGNYRSRAAFKLIQVNDKHKLLHKGSQVLDLGAAPGGWSQVTAAIVGDSGKIVALDILPVDPIPGVVTLKIDITDDAAVDNCLAQNFSGKLDLVLSDMAPNLSGDKLRDQANWYKLAAAALHVAIKALKNNGNFLIKGFEGEDFTTFREECKNYFNTVKIVKPKASRSESKEIYLLATQFKAQASS